MKKANLEMKVGIFVFFGMIVLSILVFKAGDFYLKPGYSVRLLFDFVSGIDKGSPVRLSGVTVGEVKSIQVIRDAEGKTHALATAWIAQDVVIETDADAKIKSLGLLGEKYVEILPGSPGSAALSDGATLTGRAPVSFEKITESGDRLIGKIEMTVDNINKVVTDPSFQADVKGTFSNASVVSKNLIQTSEDLKDAAKSAKIVLGRMRDGEGSIGRLLKDDKIARDLEAFVQDIKAHPWKLLKRN